LTRWALREAANPSVLLLDTSLELTDETIETCPPTEPPQPLDRVLEEPTVRSLDLHRYRARLNLRPGSSLHEIAARVRDVLVAEWGPESTRRDEAPRSFPAPYGGPRRVAESLRMARNQPVLRGLFRLPGIAEAILEPGQVVVRIAPLFSWADVEEDVRSLLEGVRDPRGSVLP
jgi:hypothetical protein